LECAVIRSTIAFLTVLALIGVVALLLWAGFRPAGGRVSAFALGVFILGSAALVGGVLGLLFGIPKSVSDPALALARQQESEGGGEGRPAPPWRRRVRATSPTPTSSRSPTGSPRSWSASG